MKHLLKWVPFVVAILALTAPLAMAQTPGQTPGAPGPAAPPAPRAPSPPVEKTIDGPVKAVDPTANTVRVGGFLGMFGTTLEVTDATQIAVQGVQGKLQNIKEGDEVKASYEVRDGKNIAKSIEVMPAEAKEGARAPSRSAAPPSGAPGTPPSGAPRSQ